MKIHLLLVILGSLAGCVEEIPIEELEEESFTNNPVSKPSGPAPIDLTAPTIYSERYSGTLDANSTSIEVTLKTTEDANCKYDFEDKTYQAMSSLFTSSNNGLDHSSVVSLMTNPDSIFIRCSDQSQNENTVSKIVDLTKPAAPPVMLTGYQHFSNFINSQCMNCHQPGGRASSWDFSPYQSQADWENSDLIEVGKAIESKIYYRLKHSAGADGPKNMPTDKSILASDVAKIRSWIDSLKVDMTAPPVISFVDSSSMINEDGGSVLIKVKLNKASAQTVTSQITVKSGTATIGSDFTLTSNLVSFAPGQLERTFQVNIIESDPTETSEGVVFTLSNSVGASAAGIIDHTLSIIEIDKTKPKMLGLVTMVDLANNQTSAEINFMTTEAADCSYARAANTPIVSMTTFTTTGSINQRTTVSDLSQVSDTAIYIKCIDGSQNTSDEAIVTFVSDKPFAPFGGTAHILPGRLEAEAFDVGENGVAYYDNSPGQTGDNYRPEDVDVQMTTDPTGGEYNIGWFHPGEWTQYTVNITQPGIYQITTRMATDNAGTNSLAMSIDGQDIASFSTPSTGGWQSYENINANNVVLSAGIKTIRLTNTSGYANVNYFVFSKTEDLTPPTIASVNCSEPLKVNELFLCRIKLEGTGAKLEFDNTCDWLRVGGGGTDYVAVGTPRMFSNNCRLTLRASRFGLKSEDIIRELTIDKTTDGVEVCDTPEIVSYNTHIKPLIENNCLTCHDNSSEDGGINYEYIHENNYTTFDASPETQVIWTKTIEQIRWGANGNPPKMPISLAGGRRHLSRCEVKVVEKFMGIEDSAAGGLACNNVPSDPGEYVMHRLNNTEYRNTISQIMQDNSFNIDVDLPEESPGALGFTTMSLSRYPSLLHTNGWWEIAEKFAAHYIANKGNVSSCNDDNCARSILQNFTIEAFRRNTVDQTYFNNLLGTDGPYQTGKSEAGVRAGIEDSIITILMSPQFLMHYHERNSDGIENLDAQELANRIAYTLWQSPPDNTLRSKANNNSILSENVLKEEVTRLLSDNRSSSFSNTFVFDWLGLSSLESKKQELMTLGYPGVNVSSVLDSSVIETQTFFSHIVQSNRNVNELLSADYTFANQELAQFYGLPGVQGNGFTQVNSGNRKGILTHASVLAAQSNASATSPTHRGKFILDKFLCDEIGSPPAGVDVEVEDAAGISRTVSNVYDFVLMANTEKIGIDQNKQIVGDTACIGCHSVTDPIGITFEGYDVMGKERQTYSDGVPVRVHSIYNGTALNNSSDAIDYINQTQKFKACLTKSLYHYSIRRDTSGLADSCAVQDIANANGDDPASIIEQIFNSASFKRTRGDR